MNFYFCGNLKVHINLLFLISLDARSSVWKTICDAGPSLSCKKFALILARIPYSAQARPPPPTPPPPMKIWPGLRTLSFRFGKIPPPPKWKFVYPMHTVLGWFPSFSASRIEEKRNVANFSQLSNITAKHSVCHSKKTPVNHFNRPTGDTKGMQCDRKATSSLCAHFITFTYLTFRIRLRFLWIFLFWQKVKNKALWILSCS